MPRRSSSGWWAWLISGGRVLSVQARRPVSVTVVCWWPLVIRPWSGAGEEQGVGVGGAAGGPVRAVVDLIVVAGFWTVRACAAAVAGVADDALVGGGDAVLAAQVDRSFAVVVEHRQVVDPVGAHPDHITHRQRGVSAGVRRRRHRDIRLVTA